MTPIDPLGSAPPPGNDDLAAMAARLQRPGTPEQAQEAAQQFESLFLTKLIGEMFESAGVGKDLPSGYRSMMEEKFANYMSEAGGMGLQAVLAAQLGGALPPTPEADQGDATTASPGEGVDAPAPAAAPPDPATT